MRALPARRAQIREKVERLPGHRLIGIDLREVATGALGGSFHEAARPALANANADIAAVRWHARISDAERSGVEHPKTSPHRAGWRD